MISSPPDQSASARPTRVFGSQKKRNGFFSRDQEGFVRAKRKIGGTLGKAGKFIYRSRWCICSRTFFFSFSSLVSFEHGAQGKATDTTANNREMARVQGGMDLGISNQGIFLFLWTELVWAYVWAWLDWVTRIRGLLHEQRQQQTDSPPPGFDWHWTRTGFISPFLPDFFPLTSWQRNAYGHFSPSLHVVLPFSIVDIVHDTRAPNKEDLPSIIFNLPMIFHSRGLPLCLLSHLLSTHCALPLLFFF